MIWPWTWFVARRRSIALAEAAMRNQLSVTKANNARNREVLAIVRERASLSSNGGGASG